MIVADINIHGEVYSTVPEQQMDVFGDPGSLREHLEANPGKFFTARKLAKEFGYRTTGTQVELRKAITELILEGHPIVSNVKGFSWATHPNMIRHNIETLQHRKMGIQRRIEALRRIFYKMMDDNPQFKEDMKNTTRNNEMR